MTPVLYILMRTDLPSMNAGKAMAQASHASNAFIQMYGNLPDVKKWKRETDQGFGTVLVLGVTGQQLLDTVKKAIDRKIAADIVTDPTYPYRVSGEVANLLAAYGNLPADSRICEYQYENNKEYTLVREEITCGYVFGDKENPELVELLKEFKLHP